MSGQHVGAARHEGCVRVPLLSPRQSGLHQAVQATPFGWNNAEET